MVRLAVVAALGLLALSCASSRASGNCPNSEFTRSDRAAGMTDSLRAKFDAPSGAVCSLSVSGFRNADHAIYVVRNRTAHSAVVLLKGEEQSIHRFEAPLGRDLAAMIERICASAVSQPSDCDPNRGVDGTWYYLEATTAPRSRLGVVTWSPISGTDADAIVDVFEALRAYVTAPEAARVPAINTLYTAVYVTHNSLTEGRMRQ